MILASYTFNNTRLLLLSGIGRPYDPVSNRGVVGRNYSYQVGGKTVVFFDDDVFNPFMGGAARPAPRSTISAATISIMRASASCR